MIIPTTTRSQTSSLDIGGVWIACRRCGSGQPVLLAHGIPGDLRTLQPVAERLADRFEAITVSLPALPKSERPSRPFGTAAQADDLVDLITSLARGPVHLVAWSYSAHAAMAVAAAKGDMVRSLCLYEPGFPTFVADETARDQAFADTMAAFGPVAEALARGDRQGALRLAVDGAAGRSGHFDGQSEEVREIHRDTADMLQELFSQTPPVPLGPADVAAIRCPATVARGAGTRVCYRIVSDEAARLIPGARHVVIPNAGHLLPEQDPNAFAALVRDHLFQAAGR
ncbi:MAG: alpha/beta hydrolase [Rhodospirillales bacterium]|jgi:pimeloyl-ACP methyl ester carboxylesterase|nr:alpha/beta hydrolase [Rhodospirillales bacterium]